MFVSSQRNLLWNRASGRARGFTLVEMLVATTITLLMIFAMVEVFKQLGDRVTDGRAKLELSGRVRGAAALLERDLARATVEMRAGRAGANGNGYFEYIEGGGTDASPGYAGYGLATDIDGNNAGVDLDKFGLFGDSDDVLMFTAYSPSEPFIGRRVIRTGTPPVEKTVQIQSKIAEIIWWTQWNDDGNGVLDPNELTLHRRALLVRPDLSVVIPAPLMSGGTTVRTRLERFYNANDISVNRTITPNSLADLSLRANRAAHVANTAFSTVTVFNRAFVPLQFDDEVAAFPQRVGEDVVLADVLAFDVRVFDPYAPVVANGRSGILEPGAPAYNPKPAATDPNRMNTIVGQGAYVDLGYSLGTVLSNTSNTNYKNNIFSRSLQKSFATIVGTTASVPAAPNRKSLTRSALPVYNPRGIASPPVHTAYTFDTWTQAYEHDGVNQDGDAFTDEGSDGLDNDGNNGVDDPGERETAPPYSRALSGIKVTVRVLEFDTRQVLQTSVVSDLAPE